MDTRTPLLYFCQPSTLIWPMEPVCLTCVPQQAQVSAPGMFTMRTSPSSAFLLRYCIVSSSSLEGSIVCTGTFCQTISLAIASTRSMSSCVSGPLKSIVTASEPM